MNPSLAPAEARPLASPIAVEEPRRSARIANVERLRIIAIFEIIGFHAAAERTLFLGGIGLATFLILTNLFNCTVSNKRGYESFARAKTQRLLWPWLFWCAVYALLLAIRAFRHGDPILSEFTPWMLLYGTKIHLWFVPFALVSGLVVGRVQQATANRSDASVIAGAALLGGAVLMMSAIATSYQAVLPVPIPQYLYALASPFLGFAVGRTMLMRDPAAKRRTFIWLGLGGALYGAAFLALVQIVPLHFMVLRYAVMLIVIIGAVNWPGREDWVTRHALPLMFGVYLIHPVFVGVLYRFDVLHQHVFVYALLVFALSNFAIWGMQRTPLRRFT